jgi:N-acyl-D-amino-acid deacylase
MDHRADRGAGNRPILVRGGTVVDGTGAPARDADVLVRDGIVSAIGPDAGAGADATEIDASGCVVAPGFVDPHTHLDAQLCWDPSASPTNRHGVTTVVLGLCGFGVAPAPEGGGEYLLRSLEQVEEIPYGSTSLGVPFAWRSWAEYTDHLASQPLGVNVAGFVPHSALRYAVMGDRARGGAASEDDRAALAAALRRELTAGAIGLATSRGPNHTDATGDPVPSRFADDDELRALVAECRGRVWQINVQTKFSGDAAGLLEEVGRYESWTAEAGARLSWTPFHADDRHPIWRDVLDHTADANRRGIPVLPQVATQPITVSFGFDEFSWIVAVPGFREPLQGFYELDTEARRQRLSDLAVRADLRAGAEAPTDGSAMFPADAETWIVVRSASRPDLEGRSLADIAGTEGAAWTDVLCDLALADDLGTRVMVPAVNRSRTGTEEIVTSEHTLIGLGDSGAHVTSINNFSYPSHVLAELVRVRGVLPLEDAVRRMTSVPAEFLGLRGRGRLAEGAPADVCVFDPTRVAPGRLHTADDLPGGARRLVQGAVGYRAVLVNGVVTLVDDEPTGAGPGTVVRVG